MAVHGRALPLVEIRTQLCRTDGVHHAVQLSPDLGIAALTGRIQLEPGDQSGQGLASYSWGWRR